LGELKWRCGGLSEWELRRVRRGEAAFESFGAGIAVERREVASEILKVDIVVRVGGVKGCVGEVCCVVGRRVQVWEVCRIVCGGEGVIVVELWCDNGEPGLSELWSCGHGGRRDRRVSSVGGRERARARQDSGEEGGGIVLEEMPVAQISVWRAIVMVSSRGLRKC